MQGKMITLNGTGMLRAAGRDLGKVNYQIVLEQRGMMRSATGTFSARAPLARWTSCCCQRW